MSDNLVDGAWDLLLGGSCVGCARPGRLLCARCGSELPRRGLPAWPDPVPAGLVEPWAATAYDGTARAMVLGLKERRLLGLARPLALLLAAAISTDLPDRGPVVLVPVPSRPETVRARGHDPTRTVTARAAGLLRRDGHDVLVAGLLRLRPGVVDQASLDAAARAANLAGSMRCPAPGLRRLGRRRARARFVVCDDVLTTGSTAREAQRALQAVGLDVARIAVVAATQRRFGVDS